MSYGSMEKRNCTPDGQWATPAPVDVQGTVGGRGEL